MKFDCIDRVYIVICISAKTVRDCVETVEKT